MVFQINNNHHEGEIMKEIVSYLENEIDLTNENSSMISLHKIVSYFDNLGVNYDIETLTNILNQSKKLISLINSQSCVKV